MVILDISVCTNLILGLSFILLVLSDQKVVQLHRVLPATTMSPRILNPVRSQVDDMGESVGTVVFVIIHDEFTTFFHSFLSFNS